MKILVADDEQPLLNFLQRGLIAEGMEVTTERDIVNVLPVIKQIEPDVVVMDRMFGDEDSVTLLPAIKHLPAPPMILMLTALDDVAERVAGLTEGADDYLCKPFDFDELLARVQVLARRASRASAKTSNTLSCGPIHLDLEQRIALLNGQEQALTRLEFDLLQYLVENPGKVLSRERILSRVWQSLRDPQTNIVDVYISRLRQHLAATDQLTIETLRGSGYRLKLTASG